MNRLFYLLILLALGPILFGQQIADAEQQSKQDLQHVYYLYKLGADCNDSAEAARYLNEGLKLAQDLSDEKAIIQGKLERAHLYSRLHSPHLAIEAILELDPQSNQLFELEDSIMMVDILSSSFSQLGAYEMAIDYKKIHCSLIGRSHAQKDYYYSNENLAFLYGQSQQFDSAAYYYKKANRIAEDLGDASIRMHCNNNIGYNYQQRGNYTEALKHYNRATQIFEGMSQTFGPDSLLYAIVRGNIGHCHLNQANFVAAARELSASTQALKSLNAHGNTDSLHYGFYLIKYARAEIALGQSPKALEHLARAQKNLRQSPAALLDYFGTLSLAYEKLGKAGLAIESLRQQQLLNQQISAGKSRINSHVHDLVNLQQKRIERERNLLALLIESEREVNSLKVILISAAAILLLLAVIIAFYSYRRKQTKKRELLEVESRLTKLKLQNKSLESRQLKEVLNHKNQDLVDFAIAITRKQEFTNELLDKLNQISKDGESSPQDIKDLKNYIKSQLQVDSNLKVFQENISKINHEFMAKLKERYPDLSPSEQQMCALLRLKLSTKEIATVKNISPASVKVMRHRLRKKMDLNSDINLSEFLDDLI
ncbi:tetratricopeptide repeat protein [Croceimicrobium sp.]|uniref:tetratricopeptide repeat protein n=1 Tax=Croceimicrobium sp. TaxID=2828340 RepID=UPI003BA8FF65